MGRKGRPRKGLHSGKPTALLTDRGNCSYATLDTGFGRLCSAEKPAATEILDGTFEIPEPRKIRNGLFLFFHHHHHSRSHPGLVSPKRTHWIRPHRPRVLGPYCCDLPNGMAKIDRLFRQIPYAAGFSRKAYHKIFDFAILKKSGVFDVELMRTIQLMVAAFNMNYSTRVTRSCNELNSFA
jgi:hypothetical protein